MKSVSWFITYVFFILVGIGFSFVISIKFLPQSIAEEKIVQVPQGSGLKKVENGNVGKKEENLGVNSDSNSELPKFEDYVYDPTGKRDPFRPFKAFLDSTEPVTEVAAKGNPLLNFSLDALNIVAILWDSPNPRAMIKGPDGNFYTLYKNTHIGRNNGKVVAIREGEVIVAESYYDEGSTRIKHKTLEIKK